MKFYFSLINFIVDKLDAKQWKVMENVPKPVNFKEFKKKVSVSDGGFM